MAFTKRRSKNSLTGKKVVDIQVLMDMVLDKAKLSESMHFETLKNGFKQVVGEQVFPHVKPLSLDKGILTLKAGSSAWKSELFLQKNAIIERCNNLLGKPLVRGLRFV